MVIAVLALGLVGGEPAAVLEHQQHVLDDSVAERVGQHDAVAISDVAAGIDDADIALGADLAGLAVPGHPVGAQIIALAVHPHVAARGDDVGLAVVVELVGAERDLARAPPAGRRRAAAAGAAPAPSAGAGQRTAAAAARSGR